MLKITRAILCSCVHIWLYAEVVRSLDITSVRVPSVVLNGSEDSVILDCDFVYKKYEAKGLEVKWFRNDDPEPIYQWIPGDAPVAMGILRKKVALDYVASTDPITKHRAIKILNPTTHLTGNFTCRISSLYDEESSSRYMIIYAPVENMNLVLYRNEDSVSITCSASGMFPRPVIDIFLIYNGKREELQLTNTEEEQFEDNSFNCTMEAEVKSTDLRTETLIQCLLTLPGTDYRMKRDYLYVPINGKGERIAAICNTLLLGMSLHLLLPIR